MISVIAASATTLATRWVEYNDPQARDILFSIAVVGGITGAYLALKQILIKRYAYFTHRHNHLGELYYKSVYSTLFPPRVWNYLKAENASQSLTLEYIKMEYFTQKELEQESDRVKTFFGSEGVYNPVMFSQRINMLEMLEVKMDTYKYSLKNLQQNIIRVSKSRHKK